MNYIHLKARAKINIALDVLSKRSDGYHNIKMIMQTLHLNDAIQIKKNYSSTNINLTCNLKWLPINEKNLVYKAAYYLKETYKIHGGIDIELIKNIPVSAGMAGGSSDCAATLIGIRNLFKLSISNQEILNLGKLFGADVPFCIMRGTALSEGIGEILTPITPHPNVFVLVVKPPINVSTANVFSKLVIDDIVDRPNIELMIKNIQNKNITGICDNFCNVLETVTIKQYPIISDIKEIMIKNNAYGSLMSGSGPSVFGYFSSLTELKNCIYQVKNYNPKIKEIFITSIYNPIIKRNDF
jgi:4-diphosphocytidyl-2-C-methyl-D-erythritol kinase